MRCPLRAVPGKEGPSHPPGPWTRGLKTRQQPGEGRRAPGGEPERDGLLGRRRACVGQVTGQAHLRALEARLRGAREETDTGTGRRPWPTALVCPSREPAWAAGHLLNTDRQRAGLQPSRGVSRAAVPAHHLPRMTSQPASQTWTRWLSEVTWSARARARSLSSHLGVTPTYTPPPEMAGRGVQGLLGLWGQGTTSRAQRVRGLWQAQAGAVGRMGVPQRGRMGSPQGSGLIPSSCAPTMPPGVQETVHRAPPPGHPAEMGRGGHTRHLGRTDPNPGHWRQGRAPPTQTGSGTSLLGWGQRGP